MDTRSGPVPSRRGSRRSRGMRGMVKGWLVTLGFGLVAGRLLTLRMSPHPDADVTSGDPAAAATDPAATGGNGSIGEQAGTQSGLAPAPAAPSPTSPAPTAPAPRVPAPGKEVPPPGKAGRRGAIRKILIALFTVLVLQAIFALCLVSAQQLLVPRNMPFGVAGAPSPVPAAVASNPKLGLDLTAYPSKSAVMTAIEQGKLYGAYVTGKPSDTLIVVPAKSFFAQFYIEPAFLAAAHKLGRPVTVQTVTPLPSSDPVGAVASLLLLPCFWLVTSAVALGAAAIQRLAGKAGAALVLVLLIFVGLAGSGGFGSYLLPGYWRNIGVIFPPQNAVNLIRNVLYYGAHNITTPLIVLFLWVVAGAAVIVYLGWIRPARAAAAAGARGGMDDARAGTDLAVPSPA